MEVLRFLQTHQYGGGISAKERDRIYRRAKAYRWIADGVLKLLPGKSMVVVPRVGDRMALVLETHRSLGHFGVQQVLDTLQKN